MSGWLLSADVTYFTIFIVVFLGLALGSFASALAHRVPRGESWISKRSHCTLCGTRLGIADLVPMLSWIANRGACRHCGQAVSTFYPLTELAAAAACLLTFHVYGFTAPFFFIVALLPFLLALLVVDIKEMILPNQLVLIVGALGVLRLGYLWFSGDDILGLAVHYVLGACLYGALAWFLGWITGLLLRRHALGFGDVKFFFVAGLWLGINDLALFCLVSGVVGVLFALGWQLVLKQRVFPFGPALITSLYLLLLYEGSLLT